MNTDLVALDILDIINVMDNDAYSAEEGIKLARAQLFDVVRRLMKGQYECSNLTPTVTP